MEKKLNSNRGTVFSVRSCREFITMTVGAMSHLWDFRQSVRTLAEDIFKTRYQKTTSENI
jgi:hypothetical protein